MKYELYRDAQADEAGRFIDPVLIATFTSREKAVDAARISNLDPDTHYIARMVVGWSEPGYRELWDLDESFGTNGYLYLNDIPAKTTTPNT